MSDGAGAVVGVLVGAGVAGAVPSRVGATVLEPLTVEGDAVVGEAELKGEATLTPELLELVPSVLLFPWARTTPKAIATMAHTKSPRAPMSKVRRLRSVVPIVVSDVLRVWSSSAVMLKGRTPAYKEKKASRLRIKLMHCMLVSVLFAYRSILTKFITGM